MYVYIVRRGGFWFLLFADRNDAGVGVGWVDVTAIKAFENVVALLNGF